VALELIGALVAEELHSVTAFDQRHALGIEAFEFDGADLRAVLFLLVAPLRLPSPAAITSFATPNRTPCPRRWPLACHVRL